MKLQKVKDFFGESSGDSSGICWRYKGLPDRFCIQKFSEYYGMSTELRLYDVLTGKKIAAFSITLKDIRQETAEGLDVMQEIEKIIEDKQRTRSKK